MKATIQITLEDRHPNKIILFGAKYNYNMVNYGNATGITVRVINVCEKYKKLCGDVNLEDRDYGSYGTFLLDCVKFDFEIVKINGLPVSIDPYKDIYVLPQVMGQTLNIELKDNTVKWAD